MLTFLRRGKRPSSLAVAPAVPPREVLVFSGGGSLGAAQVGALQALYEAGITPDAVVGCSVGAINAAYVAMNPTQEGSIALERIWRAMTDRSVFPDGRFTVARRLARRSPYLYNPGPMRAVMAQCVSVSDLSETPIPCHVVTTDLIAGEPTWWTTGDPIDVLNASACIPGLFPPVRLDGRLHVDGGVSCPVPVQRALDLGAARVWVLNAARDFHGFPSERMSALDVLVESFAISRAHLGRHVPTAAPGQQIVTLPTLSIGRHDMRDFTKTPQLIAAGREAGRAMVVAELRARVRPFPTPAPSTGASPASSAS